LDEVLLGLEKWCVTNEVSCKTDEVGSSVESGYSYMRRTKSVVVVASQ
jgi:hypothetical protein